MGHLEQKVSKQPIFKYYEVKIKFKIEKLCNFN